jgi:hypothetical protein
LWSVYQPEGSIIVDLTLTQDGNDVRGTASLTANGTPFQGDVKGQMSGRDINFKINWNWNGFNGKWKKVGNYNGSVGRNNQLSGTVWSEDNPKHRGSWRSENKTFECRSF